MKVIISDEQGTIWEVPSQSSDETYNCAINENGEVFCTCPDFLMRKACKHPHIEDVELHCKHLREVL